MRVLTFVVTCDYIDFFLANVTVNHNVHTYTIIVHGYLFHSCLINVVNYNEKPSEITLLAFTLNLENYVKTSDQIKCDFAKALASLWGSDTRSIKILTYYKMLQSCSTFCTFFSWQFFSGIDQYWKICRLRTSLQRTTGNSIDGSLQSFPGRSTFVL